jgi:hypothetical protein
MIGTEMSANGVTRDRSDRCKICGSSADLAFALPIGKMTGHAMPAAPDDCDYFQCSSCQFCYTRQLDESSHETIYDDDYWHHQDPDWYGRVNQTFRLVAMANELRQGHLPDLEILDFGCGAGGFLEIGRRDLGLNVWGADIIPPRVGTEWYLDTIEGQQFDIIVACEVIEHLPAPMDIFRHLRAHLKPFGVIAFQTAQWDRRCAIATGGTSARATGISAFTASALSTRCSRCLAGESAPPGTIPAYRRGSSIRRSWSSGDRLCAVWRKRSGAWLGRGRGLAMPRP